MWLVPLIKRLTCLQIVTSYLDSAARNMGFKEQVAVRKFQAVTPITLTTAA